MRSPGRSGRGVFRYFIDYTILFAFACIIIYFTFIINGKNFLWKPDGPSLHWMTLAYYGRWLRDLVAGIAAGTPALHEYDFSIGYGSPIISTLHWDVIGDPFNLLSFFVQPSGTEYLLNGLVILRLYLAGAAFSAYCFHMKKGDLAAMAGTFSYIFCGYSIYTAIRHPHFINPMIIFPLLLIGVERVLEKRKHGFFAFMVFISLMTSFYFSYMLGIFTIAYFVLRYFTLDRDRSVRDFFKNLLHIVLPGITGIAMSCVIIVPVIMLYTGGLRISANIKHPALYSFSYYEKIITDLLTVESPGSWTHLGLTVTAFIALLALFGKHNGRKAISMPETAADIREAEIKRREIRALRIAAAVSFILLLIPAAGSALNGFNYVSNRWEWMFSAVISYLLVYMWDDLFSLEGRQKKFIYIGTGVYFVLMLFADQGVFRSTFAAVCLLFITAFLIYLANQPHEAVMAQKKLLAFRGSIPAVLIAVTIMHVCVNAHFYYDATKENYVSEFSDYGHMYADLLGSSSGAVAAASRDNGDSTKIARYEDQIYDMNLQNTNLLTRGHGTEFYFSLANGYISQYLKDMGTGSWLSYRFQGLERRTMPDTLAGVKYFSMLSGGNVLDIPYGFTDKASYTVGPAQNTYDIYTNEYALPLGYTYSSYITREEYDRMTASQKQEALMQGVLMEDDDGGADMAKSQADEAKIKYTEKSVDYEVTCGPDVKQLTDGSFLVGRDGATVTLDFDGGKKNCETYLYVSGLKAENATQLQLYTDDDSDILPYDEYKGLSLLEKNNLIRQDFYSDKWSDNSKLFSIKAECDGTIGYMDYRTDYDLYYIGQDEYLVNLGYREDERSLITITFPTAGTYSFSSMQVICQPMNAYVEQAKALAEDTLENENHGIDTVTGTVDLDRGKVLLLTIPYDKGWTAYVDGRETPVYRANVMNSALVLSSGRHSIRLVYHTPGLRTGLVISAAGCAAFVLMLVVQAVFRFRRRRYGQQTSAS